MTVPARFLHVTFKWGGTPKISELQPVFNTALDWARYTPNCWILWSNTEVDKWNGYIKPHLSPQDSVFICEIDLKAASQTFTGWWDKWLWDWIQKQR